MSIGRRIAVRAEFLIPCCSSTYVRCRTAGSRAWEIPVRLSRNLHTCGEYFLSFATLFNMLNMCSVLSDPLIPNACVGLQASVQHSEHVFYTVDITGTYRIRPMPASDASPEIGRAHV